MYYYDSTLLPILVAMVVALVAQGMVSGAYRKYSAVRARGGMTGSQLARLLLDRHGLGDVPVQKIAGRLSDNYDPSQGILSLSPGVYDSNSIAALSVAAHECGHAFQHQEGYAPMFLRSALIPVTQIGSNLSWPLFLAGLLFSFEPLLWAGILLFSFTVLFTLVTLPLEFNASARGLAELENGYLAADEMRGAKTMLRAAAFTYVASALTAILNLLRLLAIAGGGRRRR